MNIEKFQIIDKIRLALFRHRGNVSKVSEELNIPASMVYRVSTKLKKELKNNNAGYWIAEGLFQELVLGRNQRVAECTKDLDILSKDALLTMSYCCNARVSEYVSDGKVLHTCSKCRSLCETYVRSDPEAIAEKAKLLELLRDEDEALLKFADKFGLVPNASEEHRGAKPIDARVRGTALDEDTLLKLESMTPMQRERLRNKAERALKDSLGMTPEIESLPDGPPIESTEEPASYKKEPGRPSDLAV